MGKDVEFVAGSLLEPASYCDGFGAKAWDIVLGAGEYTVARDGDGILGLGDCGTEE